MQEPQKNMESKMQKISLGVSLLGLGLMIFGFVGLAIHSSSLSIPGTAALSLQMIHAGTRFPPNLLAMTAGIAVLALIPILRVLLALFLYLRKRQVLNVLVALVVFVELVVSIKAGG